REWMAKIGASKSVAVSMLGKIKTFAQMAAIPLLLYYFPFAGVDSRQVGNLLIWVAALLTLWSMVYYLRMAWPEIAKRSSEK
ncbi:MAG: CDP-diacylglycerol--glycerol-3-phosphate 3-phosphatidyltransferase, partial [Rhodocyclaceae bacterium]|nr:CDP-diacylglycerol--glycerol-3-phosphate 3-phosphatidyltransferase [Rhodocyclaceae bacterium]